MARDYVLSGSDRMHPVKAGLEAAFGTIQSSSIPG